jgi:hypothetical protein
VNKPSAAFTPAVNPSRLRIAGITHLPLWKKRKIIPRTGKRQACFLKNIIANFHLILSGTPAGVQHL